MDAAARGLFATAKGPPILAELAAGPLCPSSGRSVLPRGQEMEPETGRCLPLTLRRLRSSGADASSPGHSRLRPAENKVQRPAFRAPLPEARDRAKRLSSRVAQAEVPPENLWLKMPRIESLRCESMCSSLSPSPPPPARCVLQPCSYHQSAVGCQPPSLPRSVSSIWSPRVSQAKGSLAGQAAA